MRNLVKKYNLDDKIQIIVADGIKFENDEKFDRVLVDAECTHEGSIKHIKKFMKSNKGNSKPKSKK